MRKEFFPERGTSDVYQRFLPSAAEREMIWAPCQSLTSPIAMPRLTTFSVVM